MKKVNDPGLDHILRLNIRAVRDPKDIFNEFTRKFGKERAREIIDGIYGVMMSDGQTAMYDKKNADYDVAMIMSGGYDADIVRRACNWIDSHKDVFGEEILEVGCDCGFMTAFLGTAFPDRKITAIDRCSAGIENARRNAEKFGLDNIEFITADAADLKDRKFDTVFSMRTMLENGDPKLREDPFIGFMEQADIIAADKQDYANVLSSLVKDGGRLISLERLGRNALYAAWFKSISEAGLSIVKESCDRIICTEAGNDHTLDVMIFEKKDAQPEAGSVHLSDEEVFSRFMELRASDLDTEEAMYEDWDARIMCQLTGGEIIEGCQLTNSRTGAKSLMVLRCHNNDDSCIMWCKNNSGKVRLEYYDAAQKQEIIDSMNRGLEKTKGLDYIEVVMLSSPGEGSL